MADCLFSSLLRGCSVVILTPGYWPRYALQVFWLNVYLVSCVAVMIWALLRGNAARNYLEFCQLLGLCLLWPVTFCVELYLARVNRAAR